MSKIAFMFGNNMAAKSKLEDLNLSTEEVKRFEEAFKKDEFKKMFMEYMEEISDPENRRTYESEIAQMEAERGMNVTFVRPEPGYVLKTYVNGEMKAFINISKSDKIDKPSTERKENVNGKKGLLWHIPHSFAPPREDFDKQKKRCQVYDFVIHPDTFRMAERNARFKKLVEDTAFDGIEKQFQVKLDRKSIRRPKIQFKGTPAATVIRTRSSNGSVPVPEEDSVLKEMPYPYDCKTTQEKMKEREELLKKTEKEDNSSQEQKKDDFFTPKYSIVHCSEMDMQEYRNAPDAKPSMRPKKLVIKIILPLLNSAAQANLDIFEKRLLLESKEPVAYKLDLNLPYPVNESEGSAKFDKQKRTLTVTLPVIAEQVPSLPTFIEGAVTTSDIDDQTKKGKPLVQVLSSNSNSDDGPVVKLNGDIRTDCDPSAASGEVNSKLYTPSVLFNLPEFSFTQDAETVSYVLKVKNVVEDSIRRKSPNTNTVQLICTSQGEGGFPLHYCLFLKFAESCRIVPDHCSIDATDDNIVLLLLKDKQSRGLWNRFWAGLEEETLEEHLFLTVSNLQQQLTELDQAAIAAASAEAAASGAEEASLCQLEVTTMNEKKLTVKITLPQKSARMHLAEPEAELDEQDPPVPAEIEVVHTRPSPTLQSILKQRSVSESSEDVSGDSESPRSPATEDDDLSSSHGSLSSSGNKHRSVSFSDHIDKATFKSTAPVKSMQAALKSKRKRHRKWEEKKSNGGRKRNNSGGSSSGDDHTGSLDAHSQSEEDFGVDDDHNQGSMSEENQKSEERGQGDGPGDTEVENVLDFRTSPEFKNKAVIESESEISGKDYSQSEDGRSSVEDDGDGHGNSQQRATVDEASEGSSIANTLMSKDGSHDPAEKGSIAAKFKSKLVESQSAERPSDSDDEMDQQADDTGVDPHQGASNPHKTVCAFEFSNTVMFDLDME